MRKILSFLFAALFALAINAETWEAGAEIAAADLQAGDIILLQNANTSNADAMWFGGYHIVKNRTYEGGCANYSLGMFPAIKDRSAFELVAGPTMDGHASFYFKEVTTNKYIGVALEAGGYAELKADISEATSFVPTAQSSGAYLISYKDGTGWRFMPFHSYGEMYIGTAGGDMAGFKFFRAVEKATSFSKGAQISCYEVADGMEILLCAPYSYYANRSATLGDMYLENTQISEAAHKYIATPFSAVPALATSVGYNEDNVWVLEYASPSTTSGYSDYYYLKSKSTGEYLFRDADANKQSSATTADKTKAESFSFAPKSVKEYGNGINVINEKTITMIPKDQTYRWFGSAHGYGFAVFNSENFANWNLHLAGISDKVLVNGLYYIFNGTTATVTYPGDAEPTADAPSSYTGDIVIPATVTYGGQEYSVTSVGNNAFRYSTITSVTFAEGLKTIGDYAFQCCRGLTTVELPNSVGALGKQAFAGASGKRMNITTFRFGKNIATCDKFLYYNSTSITTDVYVPTYIVPYTGQYPVEGVAANRIHVYPSMVADFEANLYWARYNIIGDLPEVYVNGICYELDETSHTAKVINRGGVEPTASAPSIYTGDVVIPASIEYDGVTYDVTSVADNAFKFSTITSITFSEGMQTIGTHAFADISTLTGTVELPNSVTKVNYEAFASTPNISTLIFGSGITSIGQGVCYSQANAQDIYVKTTTVPSLGMYAFYWQGATIHVFADMVSAFQSASNWSDSKYTIVGDLTRDYTYAELQAKADELAALPHGTDPNTCTAESYAAVTSALATFATLNASSPASAINSCMNEFVAAEANIAGIPLTEGYYFIASAGNGPGYSGGPYEYEDDDAMYNADGIVKWKAYDSTDATQLYYLTQKEDNSWYVYNVMDASYIDNGGTGNSGTVRTSTDKVNGQEFHPMVTGTGKFAIKSPSYCYGLAQNHNGSPNAEGNLCIWGTVNDCRAFGVNVWYLHKVSNADAEQMIADAVASTNTVVAMPTNETGGHTNLIYDGVCSDLVLTDGQPFSAPGDFTATTATYTRAMTNEWGTICLPYDVSSSSTAKYYTVSAIENNALVVSEVATLTAGTPGLVQKLDGDAITATATDVPVSATIVAPSGSVKMYGVYEQTRVEDPNAYYIKDNKFWQCNNYFFCGAFRAYFTASGAGSNSFSIVTDNDDPTAIASVEAGNDAAVAIYSTDGTRLGTLQKGVNIVKLANGKTQKVVVK